MVLSDSDQNLSPPPSSSSSSSRSTSSSPASASPPLSASSPLSSIPSFISIVSGGRQNTEQLRYRGSLLEAWCWGHWCSPFGFFLRRRRRVALPVPFTVMASTTAAIPTSSSRAGIHPTPTRPQKKAPSAHSPADDNIPPTSVITSTSSSAAASPPVELPMTELVRLLNERLQAPRWDDAEVASR
ncbi:hypothetical protein B0H14DRAFT_2775145, partial [Mycena olivaceomarginata]